MAHHQVSQGGRDFAATTNRERPPGRPSMPFHPRLARLFFAVVLVFLSLRISENGAKTSIDAAIPIILIVGRSGVGKSTFIHQLEAVDIDTGLPPVIGHTLKSETSKITFYRAVVYGKDVYLVDTPGFDDDQMRDEDVLHTSQEMMLKTHGGTKLLTAIIYMHDITQARMGSLGQKHLEHFQRLLGKDGLRHCVLVTTKWADFPNARVRSQQQSRQEDLKENYWKDMATAHSSQVLEHENTTESARNIVNILLTMRRVIDPQVDPGSDDAQDKEPHGGKKTDPGDILPSLLRVQDRKVIVKAGLGVILLLLVWI